MADELELDLDQNLDPDQGQVKQDKRIKDLSEKVKLTSQERDELAKAKEEETRLRIEAEKERDFFKNFNPLVTKYQGAAEYQDKIKEKVMAGYSAEDATVSILVQEGKYTPPVAPAAPKESPAGGSAINTLSPQGNKPLGEMTREERKTALEEVIAKGEISLG